MTKFNVKLKVGDEVMVRRGKDKGKTGKVVAIHREINKVTVEGVNIAKKHRKPTKTQPKGGMVELTKPVWVASVGLVNPTDKKKTARIGYKIDKNGEKKRVYIQAGRKEVK